MAESADIDIVTYDTFARHLADGGVSDVSMFHFLGEVELTYEHNGKVYGTASPLGFENDAVLQNVLQSQNVEYTIYDSEYEGPSGGLYDTGMGLTMMAMMLAPLLMLVVIVMQVRIIRTQSDRLHALHLETRPAQQ